MLAHPEQVVSYTGNRTVKDIVEWALGEARKLVLNRIGVSGELLDSGLLTSSNLRILNPYDHELLHPSRPVAFVACSENSPIQPR